MASSNRPATRLVKSRANIAGEGEGAGCGFALDSSVRAHKEGNCRTHSSACWDTGEGGQAATRGPEQRTTMPISLASPSCTSSRDWSSTRFLRRRKERKKRKEAASARGSGAPPATDKNHKTTHIKGSNPRRMPLTVRLALSLSSSRLSCCGRDRDRTAAVRRGQRHKQAAMAVGIEECLGCRGQQKVWQTMSRAHGQRQSSCGVGIVQRGRRAVGAAKKQKGAKRKK